MSGKDRLDYHCSALLYAFAPADFHSEALLPDSHAGYLIFISQHHDAGDVGHSPTVWSLAIVFTTQFAATETLTQ